MKWEPGTEGSAHVNSCKLGKCHIPLPKNIPFPCGQTFAVRQEAWNTGKASFAVFRTVKLTVKIADTTKYMKTHGKEGDTAKS
jgi:hypothetical protein